MTSKKERSRRKRDHQREQATRGMDARGRFAFDVRREHEERQGQTTPVVSRKVQDWIDSSPGTNMQMSPKLTQAEADQVAKILHIPLLDHHIPHIGRYLYSINCAVTPDMAFEWLDKFNIMNRIPGKSNWKMLAADVNAGRWIPNHQAFAFIVSREDGELTPILCDGQHRARGIHSAGYPVGAVLTLNVLPDSVRVMDTHMIRTVRTLITLGGKSMSTVMEGAVKFAIVGPQKGRPKPSMNEMFWFAQQFMPVLDWISAKTKKRVRNVTLASVLAAVIRADISTKQANRSQLDRFLVNLQEGITGEEPDRAAWVFREWLQTRKPKGMQASEIYLRACKQIQYFLRGESVDRVRALKEDPFPLPEEVLKGLAGQLEESKRIVTE